LLNLFVNKPSKNGEDSKAIYHLGIALRARVLRYIFIFKKDAAATANSAMPANKLRGSRPGFTAKPICQPRASACRIRTPSSAVRCAQGKHVRPSYASHLPSPYINDCFLPDLSRLSHPIVF
jgi:hypothetical protein